MFDIINTVLGRKSQVPQREIRRIKRVLRNEKQADEFIQNGDFEKALRRIRTAYQQQRRVYLDIKRKQKLLENKELVYGFHRLEIHAKRALFLITEIRGKAETLSGKTTPAKKGEKRVSTEKTNAKQELHALLDELHKLCIWELKDNAHLKGIQHNEDTIKNIQKEALQQVKAADNHIRKIIEKYNLIDPVDHMSIANRDGEEKKFIQAWRAGKKYNPQFVYGPINIPAFNKIDEEVQEDFRKLKELNIDFDKGAGRVLLRKRHNMLALLNCIRAIGTPKVTQYSTMLYGYPDTAIIAQAKKDWKNHKEVLERAYNKEMDDYRYSAKDAKKIIEKHCKEHNMPYKVVILPNSKINGSFKIEHSSSEVQLNEKGKDGKGYYNLRSIQGGIAHEIDVHAKRRVEGKETGFATNEYGGSGYLVWEEGLATLADKSFGTMQKDIWQRTMLYVIAEELALKKGFYDIFEEIYSYFIPTKERLPPNEEAPSKTKALMKEAEKQAWTTTVRIKRGLTDTGKPGGFMKDHVYFVGLKLVEELLAKGGNLADFKFGKLAKQDVEALLNQYDINKYFPTPKDTSSLKNATS